MKAVTIGAGRTVHAADKPFLGLVYRTRCGAGRYPAPIHFTNRPVTCKRCLAKMSQREKTA